MTEGALAYFESIQPRGMEELLMKWRARLPGYAQTPPLLSQALQFLSMGERSPVFGYQIEICLVSAVRLKRPKK